MIYYRKKFWKIFKNGTVIKLLFYIIFVLITLELQSQNAGLELNLGVSKNGDRYKVGESIGIGYFHKYNLNSNFLVDFQGIFGYRSLRNKGTSFHGQFNDFRTEYKYNEIPRVFYFDIPVQLVYRYKNIHLGVGYQFSTYVATAYNRKLSHWTYYANGKTDEMKFSEKQIVQNTVLINPWRFKEVEYKWFDHGYILSLGYSIAPQLEIRVSYYAGFNNILSKWYLNSNLKFQQGYISIRKYIKFEVE